jgi:arylsulfatase
MPRSKRWIYDSGIKVPLLIRWPGKIKPGTVLNGIMSHIDMFPTLLAAAGDETVKERLLAGDKLGGSVNYKVHLDGYNQVPYLTGQAKESPRNSVFYVSDDGDVMAVRVGDYKFNLAVQRATKMDQWAEPFVKLRVPHIVNLRRDPFERADFNSNTYWDWMVDHIPQMYLMQDVVAGEIESYAKFPPRQKPASFNLDAVMAQVSSAAHH